MFKKIIWNPYFIILVPSIIVQIVAWVYTPSSCTNFLYTYYVKLISDEKYFNYFFLIPFAVTIVNSLIEKSGKREKFLKNILPTVLIVLLVYIIRSFLLGYAFALVSLFLISLYLFSNLILLIFKRDYYLDVFVIQIKSCIKKYSVLIDKEDYMQEGFFTKAYNDIFNRIKNNVHNKKFDVTSNDFIDLLDKLQQSKFDEYITTSVYWGAYAAILSVICGIVKINRLTIDEKNSIYRKLTLCENLWKIRRQWLILTIIEFDFFLYRLPLTKEQDQFLGNDINIDEKQILMINEFWRILFTRNEVINTRYIEWHLNDYINSITNFKRNTPILSAYRIHKLYEEEGKYENGDEFK
jgi:hypothetical protein